MIETDTHRDTQHAVRHRTIAGGALFLGGGLSTPSLARGLSIPLLCLPQRPDATVFECWLEALELVGVEGRACWVLTDDRGESKWRHSGCPASLILDQAQYRGPAGVVLDASSRFEGDGPRFVIEHTRMLERSDLLQEALSAHLAGEHAVSIAVNPDGSFSGILIANQNAIDIIPGIGFMDIKEQWLPAANANGFSVQRVPLSGWSRQIRSLDMYLEALDAASAFRDPDQSRVIGRGESVLDPSPYAGAMTCAGATIEPGASVARSVVAPGGRVEAGAVVVRSLVSRGAVVPTNAVVIDSIVDSADTQRVGRV